MDRAADLKVQYEARLQDKNDQIKSYREAAALNARTAEEALIVAKSTKEVLDKLDISLRDRSPGHGRV